MVTSTVFKFKFGRTMKHAVSQLVTIYDGNMDVNLFEVLNLAASYSKLTRFSYDVLNK